MDKHHQWRTARQWDAIPKEFGSATTCYDRRCLGAAFRPRANAMPGGDQARIYGSWQHSLEQQLDIERDGQRKLGASADYAEGVAAFTEKRPPTFTGVSDHHV